MSASAKFDIVRLACCITPSLRAEGVTDAVVFIGSLESKSVEQCGLVPGSLPNGISLGLIVL